MMDIASQMTMILGTMVALLIGIFQLQTKGSTAGRWLPCPKAEPSKYAYELWVALYSPLWMGAFGVVVAFELYTTFDAWMYLYFCGALTLPLLFQPLFLPGFSSSPDAQRHLQQRFCTKANIWLIVYSFIGNYWYTHYFYSVLRAKYTMPAHRLNNVPIAMYFATYFYFSTYHVVSNVLLRKIETRYQAGWIRSLLVVTVIGSLSYFLAFMETLSISSYPDWQFEDREQMYRIGSAFYGIYFIISFPAFYTFDRHVDSATTESGMAVSLWDTIVSSSGYGMLIMCLLDAVRLVIDIPLIVGGAHT